jgi:hypothetical protein
MSSSCCRRCACGCIVDEPHDGRDRDLVNILLVDDRQAKLLSHEVVLEEIGENLIKGSSAREAFDAALRRRAPPSEANPEGGGLTLKWPTPRQHRW